MARASRGNWHRAAAGGAWESRHAAPIHLRGADLRLGAEPKQLVLYEGAEHRLDECAAGTRPAVNAVDSSDPPYFSIHLVSGTSPVWHDFPVLRSFQASLVCCSTSLLTLHVLRSWVPIIVNRRPLKTGAVLSSNRLYKSVVVLSS